MYGRYPSESRNARMLCLMGPQNELTSRAVALTSLRNRGRKTRLSPSRSPAAQGCGRPVRSCARQRGNEGGITTQCETQRGGTVDDEIQAAPPSCGPLLRHHLPEAHSLPRALSTTLARRANRPVRGHAKARSPYASTLPPHPGEPQWREVMGRGRRKCPRRATCVKGGDNVVAGSPGITISDAPACGPDWERSRARRSGVNDGSITHEMLS